MRKMENDSVGALYEALSREGFSDLGDEQAFRDKLGDERNRLQLYWALDSAGYKGLGDYGTFDDRLSACYADKNNSVGKSAADRAMDRWANSSARWASVAGEAAALTEAERQRKAAERRRYEAIVDLGIDEAKKRIPKKQPKLYPTGMGLYLPVPEPKGEGPTPEEERDGRLYRQAVRQLERAKRDRQIAEYADRHPADLTDATNWNGLKQFIHAAWKGIQSPSVYSFGTTDIADDLTAIRILKKAEKEGLSGLSQAEEDYITAMALANTVSGMYDKTIYQQAGESTAISAPYMVQFAATSGLGNALTAGARGALKRILARNLTSRTGRKLADMAVGVAGVTARSAAMSLVQPTTVANVTDRLTDRLELNDRDEVTVARKGDNLASAIGKGFLANTIDNVSEMSGPMLKSLVGVVPKGLKRLSPKTVDFVAQTGGAKAIGRFNSLLKKAGWHGTLEEWGEEQVGTALNALLVGDSEWSDLVDLEQQLTTGLSVAAMGGTFTVLGSPGALARKRAIRKRIGESRRRLAAVGLSESEIAELDNQLVSGTLEQTGRLLVDEAVALRRKGLSPAEQEKRERQLSAKMEYAAVRSTYAGMIGALKERIGAAVEQQRAEIEALAHRDRGLLIESRTKSGGTVNVVGGRLSFSPDGTIDAEHSDETIYVRREGQNVVMNVRELDRVTAVTPLQTELDRVLPQLKEQLAKAEADEIESDDKPVESDRSAAGPGVETEETTVVRQAESDRASADDTGVSEGENERDADGSAVEEQTSREESIDTEDVPVSETEADPFGKPFVKAADGTTVFGHISSESGLTEAPIRLSLGEDRVDESGRYHGYGLLHIEAGHGKQIRDAGFESVAAFVETVAQNYTDILEGNTVMNRPTYLLRVSDEYDNTLFVQLSRDGNFWNVNSAGIFRKKYSRRKEKVFTVPAFRFGTDTDADGVNHDQTEGAVVTSGNSPQTFENKDRQFSEEKQESTEKNIRDSDVESPTTENGKGTNDGTGGMESGVRQRESNRTPSIFDVVRTLYSNGKEVASRLFQHLFFDVAQPPKFMQELGLRGDKFTIRYDVIARHFGKDRSHTLGERDWERLPQALQTPFAISKFTDKKDSYRIYTTLQTEGGEYIVVGADVKNAGRVIEVNAISTVFGRRNGANLPKNEEVIYRSNKITPEQSSLLERPNFAQYPTEQELSKDKDNGNSLKNNDSGEKIALTETENSLRGNNETVATDERRESGNETSDGREVYDDEKILYRRDEVKDRIENLFHRALSGEFKGKSISIGTLTGEGKTYLEQISGVTFKDRVDFVLNPSDLVHIYKRHFGNNETDERSIPLGIEDIRSIADVVSFPDRIIYSKENAGEKRKMFFFLKEAENGTYNLLEIYADKKGNLTAKTFYKTKEGVSQRVMTLNKSLHTTSETDGTTLNAGVKIPQMFENTSVDEKNLRDGDGIETHTVGRAEPDEHALDQEISALSSRLHTPVRVIRRLEDITNDDSKVTRQQREAKGWFDVCTGEVTIVLPNADSIADVRSTLLHEIVGHKGLRGLLGDGMSAFYEQVYADMPTAARARYTSKYGRSLAAEEYVADLAEHPEKFPGIWSRIVNWFREQLRRAGLPVALRETDIRYLLWKSRRRLMGSEDPLGMARQAVRDAAFRRELSTENESNDYDTRYLYREAKTPTGETIDFRQTNVKQLSQGIEKQLQKEGIAWTLKVSNKGTHYYRFPYKGIPVSVRIANHTKSYKSKAPRTLSESLTLFVRGVGDNRLDKIWIDTIVLGLRTEDVFRLLNQLSGLSIRCYAHASKLRSVLQDYAYLYHTPRKEVLSRLNEAVGLNSEELSDIYLNTILSGVEKSEGYRHYRMQADSERMKCRYRASNGIEIDFGGDCQEKSWIMDTSGFMGHSGSKSHRAKISDRRAALEEAKTYLRAQGIEPIEDPKNNRWEYRAESGVSDTRK